MTSASRAWFEKDFYKALGVPENAKAEDIKRAYRKLARQYHPDRNPDDKAAEERMKEISEASDVLSDPKKRAEYDEVRKMAASGYRGGFGPGGAGPGGNVRFEDLGGFDLGDILGGRGGSVFGDLFGRGARGGGGPSRRGADLETAIRVSFEDAVEGATVPVRLTRDAPCDRCGGSGAEPGTSVETCPTCGGTGTVGENQGVFSFVRSCDTCGGSGRLVKAPCAQCRGSGVRRKTEEIKVRIPSGVHHGARIRLRGRGEAAGPRGQAGDLYVVVNVDPHPIFGRQGDDLTMTLPVTFTEAALGAQVKVPTLDGPVTLKIPAGTQNGRTFRVKGRGAPKRKGGKGDLFVTVQVVVPEKLSGKEKELLEQFAASHDASPRTHLGV